MTKKAPKPLWTAALGGGVFAISTDTYESGEIGGPLRTAGTPPRCDAIGWLPARTVEDERKDEPEPD